MTKVANLAGWDLTDKHETIVIQKIIRRIFNYDIGVLKDKSLITIDDQGILWMHDLLQDMGQEIVRRESPKEPGGRSRLWIYKDVIHVLKKNTGTEVVEGIMLNMPIQEVEHLSAEVFSKMKILRLLIIGNMKLPKGFINGTMKLPKVLIRGNVQLPKDLSYLSDELRIIEWHGYPFKSMPTSFQPNKLVEIRMHCSRIIQLWKGIMILDALKLMDLSDSQYLIEIPDLSGAPKLKQLILRHCKGDLFLTILRHYIIKRCCNPNSDSYLTIPGIEKLFVFSLIFFKPIADTEAMQSWMAEMIVLLPEYRVCGTGFGAISVWLQGNLRLINVKRVPVGAMPESFGGEYCCLFGDRLWDEHIAVLLIHEMGHLIRKPQKSICIILAHMVALVQQIMLM
ncbi:hypothetical protein CMV_024436 [Castanea mollissima]|uniref:Disease resistance protein Roq1-like winged-helix domain-containing protein n=1 Tax=Castanea mollissima TaxID=60419 RepID=A0A8J4QNR8_9ROSI|nr:hypothetical protein CMV_024436 [Castanea mollissima]